MAKKRDAKRSYRGRHPVIEFTLLCAMALVATAFATGLHVQGGIGLISAAIAGGALFLVMASSQAALSRAFQVSQVIDQVGDLQASAESFRENLERIDRFAGRCEGFEQLADRVDDLERGVANVHGLNADTLSERFGQLDGMAADIDRLGARVEAIRSQFQSESKDRHDKLTAELQVLETLVKQMAERMAATGGRKPRSSAVPDQDHGTSINEPLPSVMAEQSNDRRDTPGADDGETGEPYAHEQEQQVALDAEYVDTLVLDQVRKSIETNKIDLYLQPIVTLPQRRSRYYEALTRLRNEAGKMILPKDYLHVAETAGIMPLIDNVMLFRSVQVLRRLTDRSSARGLFCNISVHSLLDPEFFPEFTSFMEQNRLLADSLFFEFSQDMILRCGPIEDESLNALSTLGFRFSLDGVRNLDVDFQALHDKGFRFVKIESDVFLHGMADAGARIHQADMRSYLDRFGLQLIVEKIEDERSLANLLDYDVKLGQGFLFSEPRPVRPEVFRDKADAAA